MKQRAPTHRMPVYQVALRQWVGTVELLVEALLRTIGTTQQISIRHKTPPLVSIHQSIEDIRHTTIGYENFRIDRWTTPPRVHLPDMLVQNGTVFFIFTTTAEPDAVAKVEGWRAMTEKELTELDVTP